MESSQDRTASLMTPAKLAQAGAAARAPVSPAAWLDKMATDAGHMHVRRLAELRAEMELQARERADAPVAAALSRLGEALPQLDFGLLQPRGWWARTTGKARSAGAEFSAQFEQVEQAVSAVLGEAQALQQRQQRQSSGTERTLLEFEVEFRAIDTIIDQGARWLQDMRNQIKARQAAGGDAQAQQQMREDTVRCELLVARLKLLRAAVGAAQQAHEQARATAARRAAMLQGLQRTLASELKAWRVRLGPVVSAAAQDNAGALNVEGAVQTHQELQQRVAQARAEAAQLATHEQTLAQLLSALGEQLAAAR